MRKLPLLLVLLAATATLGACTPSVQLKTAVLEGGSFQGPRFEAVMSFENPNGFDVQVRTVRANVHVEGVRGVVPVNFSPNVWIPAGQTVNIPIPVTVPWGMVPPLALMTLSGTEVPFRIVGRADVTATRAFEIDEDNYAFNEEGKLPKSFFVQAGGTNSPLPITLGLGIPLARR